jgi:mannose-6-phosphate isomerase-like protein (cupin superfamily)
MAATTETKYGKLLFSGLRDEMKAIDYIASPAAYFRGAHQIPGASINMGWQVIVKPTFMEKAPHTHDCDEYFAILGGQLPDLFGSFDAEVELWMGPEHEKHIITEPTFVFIPKGFLHCPLNFKRVTKPLMFQAIHLGPRFHKIMDGKEYWFEGPDRSMEGWKHHPVWC